MEEKTKKKQGIWFPALMCIIVMTILCGIIYPLVMTGIGQLLMPKQANGSLVAAEDGTVYGSELIAQTFTQSEYLIGRPDTGSPTNLSPVSEEQKALIEERSAWWHALDPENTKDIPMDLVTASGSGVDPHISPAAAEYQVSRIARERHMSEDAVREVVARHTDGRMLGFMGEERVNVLLVNLELDGKLN